MPTYYCTPCKTKFFAHDTKGRICQSCKKYMVIGEPPAGAYAVVQDTKQPVLNFGPKYSGQIIMALIDGRLPQYKGACVGEDNFRAFLADQEVSKDAKDLYRKQEGERQSAENLDDKERAGLENMNKRLRYVQDYEPNTEEQTEKIRSALTSLPKMGECVRMYIVAHHDGEAQRMAGLTAATMAQLIAAYPHAKTIRRLVLVGCHTAGEAASADNADTAKNSESFAAQLHSALGKTHALLTEVAGYTSFVQIRPSGEKRERFDEAAQPAPKLAKSKVVFSWNEKKEQVRSFAN